jgi:glycine/D-amino acid oxidase-like deaminating enzyme
MNDAKIAIVGGGICGVTAAHAIKTRLQTIAPNHKVEIVIYEGDSNALGHEDVSGKESQASFKQMLQPIWNAATARNANSLGRFEFEHFHLEVIVLKMLNYF